jgi:integrase
VSRVRNAENRGLPARWRLYHGAYYYFVPPGLESLWDGKKQFRLGKTLPEAYRVWSGRLDSQDKANNIGQLLDRYLLEVVPNKAPKTQTENARGIHRLRAVFGAMALNDFKPRHVYQYVDKRGAKTAAHREIEVLSHAFTKAVEWGYLDRHPFKGQVRLEGEPPRVRYLEDWEVVEILRLEPHRKSGSVLMIQAYIRLKLVTGLARSDLLRLRQGEHLRDDGIHVTRHKTGTRATVYDYLMVPERLEAVTLALRTRPALSPFLFCNRMGQGYIDEATGESHGWDSMWQRFVARVMAETSIKERFTEHDLRAKVGSDAESLEKARALLQHADIRTTQRVYRRKPERV